MPTGKQIRAARVLLDWDADDLAGKCKLTRETILNVEREDTQARETTIDKIVKVINDNGVEFTDNFGVRFKPQGVEVLVGQKGLQHFFNGVYDHVKAHGGTIMQLGVDENQFWAMGVEFSNFHRKRMTDLVKERDDIKVLAIICEGDTNFIASNYNQYRWISKELFSPVPFYIYGECLAIMNFQTVPVSPTIILHKFPAITEAYRKQFEAFWKMSKEPDVPQDSTPTPDKPPSKRKK